MKMDIYNIFSALIVLTAAFSYINQRFIKLPATIGIMIISLLTSLAMVILGSFYPGLLNHTANVVRSIDFETILMRVMLSFLLFAGAFHVNIQKLKKEIIPIVSFSTIGVLISTACIGTIMFFLFHAFSANIPFVYCLVFGALISPTDPIAVLGILRKANIPSSLEIKITGASLFNGGVGIVLFISLYEIARLGADSVPFLQVTRLFFQEAGGGILLGNYSWLCGVLFITIHRSLPG